MEDYRELTSEEKEIDSIVFDDASLFGSYLNGTNVIKISSLVKPESV